MGVDDGAWNCLCVVAYGGGSGGYVVVVVIVVVVGVPSLSKKQGTCQISVSSRVDAYRLPLFVDVGQADGAN